MQSASIKSTLLILLAQLLIFGYCGDAIGEKYGKLGLYGIYMEPNGDDAEGYSESNGGIGVQMVWSLPRPLHFLGVVAGFENTIMGSDERLYTDERSQVETLVTTTQRYSRLLLGGEIGGHGTGFFRPHAGINFAIINYGYSIDRESSPAQESDTLGFVDKYFSRDNKWVFGHDITLGLDLRLSRTLFIDGGVKYLTTYSVPVQLNNSFTKVHPEYFQIYFSIGAHMASTKQDSCHAK